MDVPDGNLLAEYVIDVNLSDEMDVARGLEPRMRTNATCLFVLQSGCQDGY